MRLNHPQVMPGAESRPAALPCDAAMRGHADPAAGSLRRKLRRSPCAASAACQRRATPARNATEVPWTVCRSMHLALRACVRAGARSSNSKSKSKSKSPRHRVPALAARRWRRWSHSIRVNSRRGPILGSRLTSDPRRVRLERSRQMTFSVSAPRWPGPAALRPCPVSGMSGVRGHGCAKSEVGGGGVGPAPRSSGFLFRRQSSARSAQRAVTNQKQGSTAPIRARHTHQSQAKLHMPLHRSTCSVKPLVSHIAYANKRACMPAMPGRSPCRLFPRPAQCSATMLASRARDERKASLREHERLPRLPFAQRMIAETAHHRPAAPAAGPGELARARQRRCALVSATDVLSRGSASQTTRLVTRWKPASQ